MHYPHLECAVISLCFFLLASADVPCGGSCDEPKERLRGRLGARINGCRFATNFFLQRVLFYHHHDIKNPLLAKLVKIAEIA